MEDKDFIGKGFLENNLFEQSKVGAGGSFPWRYEDKHCYIVLTLSGVGNNIPSVYIENRDSERSLEYAHIRHKIDEPKMLRKSELQECMKFLNIEDEFDYNF